MGRRWPSGAVVVALCTALVLGVVFGWLTAVVAEGGSNRVDLLVEGWVIEHRVGWATSVGRVLTHIGSSVVLWPLIGVAAVGLVWRGRAWPSVVPVASLGGVLLAKEIVKPLVNRPRPPAGAWLTQASGLAYPSGHAMQAVAVFGALAIVLSAGRSRRIQAALWASALALALMVGWTRLYLGIHWLTDVLGGYALAGAWVALLGALWLAVRPGAGPTRSEPYRPDPGR